MLSFILSANVSDSKKRRKGGKNTLKEERILSTDDGKIHIIFESDKNFFKNAIDEKKGYSTIPMQLMLIELIYCMIFFNGIEKMFKERLHVEIK